MKRVLSIVLVLIMCLSLCACVSSGGDDKDKDSSKGKEVYGVGETAECNGVSVTMLGVNESNGSGFCSPDDGMVYLVCEFEIVNNSDEEVVISSVLSFDAYCDDYACNMNLSAMLECEDKEQLDATLAPGKKLNGIIGYEVSEDWGEIEIHYTPDALDDDYISFVASK